MYIPGPSINIYGTPRFVARKTLFDESRIKRKPPKSTTEDESKPGYLCWGVVGDLPSGEPVPYVSFEVKEQSRETTPNRKKKTTAKQRTLNLTRDIGNQIYKSMRSRPQAAGAAHRQR
jgi:hypothetical protein